MRFPAGRNSALITCPKLVLADEPTGALDSRSTDELLKIFTEINQEGQTILMVTHSTKAASRAGRVLFIKDGEVFHQLYRGGCTNQEMYQKISDTLTLLATDSRFGEGIEACRAEIELKIRKEQLSNE